MDVVNLNQFCIIFPCYVMMILTILWIWRIVNWVWIRPLQVEKSLRAQGFNGNPYRLLHGDSRDMAAMIRDAQSRPIHLSQRNILPRVLPLHHHIIANYGKASFIWIGPEARVLIMDPLLIQEILNKNNVFKKPTPNPLAKYLVCGLSGYEDLKWAKHRKIINPAFYLEKLKNMVGDMSTSCSAMAKKWEDLFEGRMVIEIDVQPYLWELSCEIISKTAFGSRNEEGKKILKLQGEQAELTRQVLQSVYVPGWRYVPTRRNRRLKEINSQVCTLLRSIINQRQKAIELGHVKGDDLLGILLKSNEKEIEEDESNCGMSIDEVIEECKTFYFSGQESTSNLLSWTMFLLSVNKEWQDRAREEVFRVFGNDPLHFDGLNRLKTLTMIIYEVLRLYPPGVIFNRIIYEDTKLGHMTLPAGVHLLLPIILLHYDRELWGDDAHDFKPERFSQGIAKATNNQLAYFPFSWGPRTCIGNNFSLLEVKVTLATILRRFSFQLSASYTHAPAYVVTLQPQFGVQLMLTRL
ncbi:cytochrome P450 CYP72A219-like [Andrographis paniculata]|uniref:cytochrome P450 CYP72A219-like n=1 Tax=Andrographis paniculata TaxID=175694 RepID=UPI0021E86424|nr:cytochrome P450 CYP72A219-like [Andrographis paniculata]